VKIALVIPVSLPHLIIYLTLNPSPRGEGLKKLNIKFLHPLLPWEKSLPRLGWGPGDEVILSGRSDRG
jgi:hypothetical protein